MCFGAHGRPELCYELRMLDPRNYICNEYYLTENLEFLYTM